MTIDVINLPELIDQQNSRRFQFTLATLLCAFMVVEGYDMQVLGYAAPAMIHAWHSSKAAFGTVFGGAMVGFMVGALLFANLGDTHGRKKAIIGGMLIFGGFTLAAVLAEGIPSLLVLRTLAGLGLGAAVPNAVALMAEYAPHSSRARYIAILYLGYTGGSALGGVLSAELIPNYGWQSAFWLGGGLPLVLALLMLVALPESVRLLALRGGNEARILAILRRLHPEKTFTSPVRFAEREAARPGVPVQNLFRNGYALVSALLWIGCIGNMMTHHFMTSWLPTIIEEGGQPLSTAIIAASLLQAMGSAGGLLVCWAIDRWGARGVAVALLLAVPCIFGLAQSHNSEWLLMGCVSGIGFFLIGSQTGLNALAGTVYPTYVRSTGAGWANGMGRIGAIFGPMIGGGLLSLHVPDSVIFIATTIPVIAAAVALWMLGRLKVLRDEKANAGLGAEPVGA